MRGWVPGRAVSCRGHTLGGCDGTGPWGPGSPGTQQLPLSAQGTPGLAEAAGGAWIRPARSLRGRRCSRSVGGEAASVLPTAPHRPPALPAAPCCRRHPPLTALPAALPCPPLHRPTHCIGLLHHAAAAPRRPPHRTTPCQPWPGPPRPGQSRAGLGEPCTPRTPRSPHPSAPSSPVAALGMGTGMGTGTTVGPSTAASAERSRLRQKPHLSPRPAAAPRAPGDVKQTACCHQLPLIDLAPGTPDHSKPTPGSTRPAPHARPPCTAPGRHGHMRGYTQGHTWGHTWGHTGPAPSPRAASDPLQHPRPSHAPAQRRLPNTRAHACTRARMLHAHACTCTSRPLDKWGALAGPRWGEHRGPLRPQQRHPHAGTPRASPLPAPHPSPQAGRPWERAPGPEGRNVASPCPGQHPPRTPHPRVAGDMALGPMGSLTPGWG